MKLPIDSIILKMDNTNIVEVQCIKYIGVILNSKLSWIISYVKSKTCIGIMYKARNYINKYALLGLYHSYIYIALNLGETHQIVTLILYLCYRNVFLESVSFLVMMFQLNRYLSILQFLYRLINKRIGIMMYKYANCILPSPVMNRLYTVNRDVHEHNTRPNHVLHTNKGSTNQFNKCFSNISEKVWNALQNKLCM